MSPIGFYGTPLHVITNKKVDSKVGTVKDIAVNDIKIAGKTYAAAGAVAGAAGIATAVSPKLKNMVNDSIKNVGKALAGCDLGGTTLYDILKADPIISRINSLPTPVKAAIGAGMAVLTVISPIVGYHKMTKDASIEGKHEAKGCIA